MKRTLLKYNILIIAILLVGLNKSSAGPISTGFWIKVKIEHQGVYRVNFTDLKNAGFPVSGLDPRKLQLRGHQGGSLPEFNGNRKTGLPEIPIWVAGESDGVFDASDYILFYGGVSSKWSWSSYDLWEHKVNDYSNTAWLYLGLGDQNGKRISLKPAISNPVKQTITKSDFVWFHDSDMVNPPAMGRVWLGEKFGNETLKRTFSINLPALCDDSVFARIAYGSGMIGSAGSMAITVNGIKKTQNFGPVQTDIMAFIPLMMQGWYPAPGGSVSVTLDLNRPNTQSAAWLDYLELISPRKIVIGNEPYIIRSGALQTGISSRVEMEYSAGLRVWGFSNETSPSEYSVTLVSGSKQYFETDSGNSDRVFVAFDPANCYNVAFDGVVKNTDILGGDAMTMLIISHPDMITASEKLASFRRTSDGYSVKVVTPQAIYDEYSCGAQDIVAIRDYIRDEYTKSAKASKALKYVLLMGAGSFDYKDRLPNNTNRIPVYEDYESGIQATYCLDDFYGYLDSNMGRPGTDPNKLGLAVGRIPARTASEAAGVVEKLIRYYSPKSLGPWRSELAFVCDDVDNPSFERDFETESEQYAGSIASVHPEIQVNKIYADAYKQVTNGNTEQYPDVTAAITKSMNNGSIFMNYQGHGGERGWAQEAFLTIPVINSWSNKWNMPVLFTATCEFSRYDNPALQSGGELTLINPNGGAVALMTTTRQVFVYGNSQINNDFWTNYGFPKPNEPIPTVGDLFQRMKNRPSVTTEDNKFALLGDPSMRLAFPIHKVVLDSINGKNADGFSDTLKAFSVVRLKGHIHERLGNKFSTFNGQLWVKVLDKPQTRFTLDNDKNNSKLPYKDQTSMIYKGIVTVENGEFSVVFSVPKDIAYNIGLGKILFYAHNGVTDASGAKEVFIGGSETVFNADDQGPEVKLYMNDTTFTDGGEVLESALFIAKIKDISGINATGSGIGRDMMGILDKGSAVERNIIMNEYFDYDLNSYTQGTVKYPLMGLSEGKHTIYFKVWDIHNNSSEAVISFVVVNANKLHVTYQNVYPTPFSDQNFVTILFEHNKSGKDLEADLEVFDPNGILQYSETFHLPLSTARENRVTWNGRSKGGANLPNGFYIYQLYLRADDGSHTIIRGKMMKM